MGVLGLLVLVLYELFRALEWISVHVSRTGSFLNTNSNFPPSTRLTPHQCRTHWLLFLHYPSSFYTFLYTIAGATLIIQGYSVVWLTHVYKWWAASEVFEIIRIQILYLVPIPLDPTRHPFLLLLAHRSLIISSLLAALTITAILAPKILNRRQRKVTRRESLWVVGVGISWLSTLVLNHCNTVMNEEIYLIIMPVSLGCWFWVAAVWGVVARWDSGVGGERGRSMGEGSWRRGGD